MCGGGGSGLLSHCDSFYKLCCSLRPPKLPEQTETGATEAGEGSCSQRHIQYTTTIGFAFFDSIVGGIFWNVRGWLHPQETSHGLCQLVDVFQKSQRDTDFPSINCNRYNRHGCTIKLILRLMA